MFSDFGAAAARGKDLRRIQKARRIEYALDAHHRVQIGFAEDKIHEIFLLVADAVLTTKGTADSDTQLHDFFTHAKNLVDLIGIPAIKQDQWMEVPIAGVKDIRDGEAVPTGHPIDCDKHLGQSRPGNDSIHSDHVGSEPAHGSEGALSAEPESGALVVIFRDTHLIGIVAPADFHDGFSCFIQACAKSIDFDQ